MYVNCIQSLMLKGKNVFEFLIAYFGPFHGFFISISRKNIVSLRLSEINS